MEISSRVKLAEKIKGKQIIDCFSLGLALDLILLFSFLGLGVSWPYFLALLIPPAGLYKIIWWIEYRLARSKGLSKIAAKKTIGFSRQIAYILESADNACAAESKYVTLGWWIDKHRK